MNNILIIENDEIYGGKLKKRLVQNGFSTDWVKDGEKALKLLKKKKYDGLLLDLNLGDNSKIHGEGILQVLKKNLCFPIIVMTAYDDRVSSLLDYDIYTIFRKPIDISILIHSLKKGIEYYNLKSKVNKIQPHKKTMLSKYNYNSILIIMLLLSTITVLLINGSNIMIYFLLIVVIIIQIIGGENINEIMLKVRNSVFKIKSK